MFKLHAILKPMVIVSLIALAGGAPLSTSANTAKEIFVQLQARIDKFQREYGPQFSPLKDQIFAGLKTPPITQHAFITSGSTEKVTGNGKDAIYEFVRSSKAGAVVENANVIFETAAKIRDIALIRAELAQEFLNLGDAKEALLNIDAAEKMAHLSRGLFEAAKSNSIISHEITSVMVQYDAAWMGIEAVSGYAVRGVVAAGQVTRLVGFYINATRKLAHLTTDFLAEAELEGASEAARGAFASAFTTAIFDTPLHAYKGKTLSGVLDRIARGSEKSTLSGILKKDVFYKLDRPLVKQLTNLAVDQPEVRKETQRLVKEMVADKGANIAVDLTEKLIKRFVDTLLDKADSDIMSIISGIWQKPTFVALRDDSKTFKGQLSLFNDNLRQAQTRLSLLKVSSQSQSAVSGSVSTSVSSPISRVISGTAPLSTTISVINPPASATIIKNDSSEAAPTPFSRNAPELVTATFMCDERPHIDVKWSSIGDADGYTLWRNYDRRAFTSPPNTDFRDQSINSNSAYEYWVVAELAGVKGKISNSLIVTVPECATFMTRRPNYPVGAGPHLVKTGDLNGDHHIDIVTADYNNSSVSTLLGDGRGAFESAIVTNVGVAPAALFVFDTNGDRLDDVVVSASDGVTTILLSRRDGSLKKSQMITGYVSAVGDFDMDHRIDLFGAFGNWPSTWHNAIQRNNGTGTFDEVTAWRRSEQVLERGTVGDFNADGKLDIMAVAPRSKGTAVFLPGRGDGSFGAPMDRNLADSAEGQFSQTAHFSVDSDDAVISSGSAVSLLSGGQTGSSVRSVLLETGLDRAKLGLVTQFAFADFDGDGRDDVVVPDPIDNKIRIRLTKQAVSEFESVSLAVGNRPIATVTADFNEDGQEDIAVANFGSNSVSVLFADEQFDIPVGETHLSIPTQTVALPPRYISAYELFQSPVNYTVGASPQSMALGDFNADGARDIAVANYNGNSLSVLLGKGDGGFRTAETTSVGKATYGVYAGNLDGDNKDDLIVGDSYGNSYALISNGDGSFRQSAVISGYIQAAGDLNGDGSLDAFMAGDDNRVYLGNGDGTFRESPWHRRSWMLQRVVIADFNGDKKLDAVGTADPWPLHSGRRPVVLLLGRGDGTFDSGREWDLAQKHRMQWTAAGDFNGDGRRDLLVAHRALSMFLGRGDATFGSPVDFQIGNDSRTRTDVMFAETGDWDGDGYDDIAVPNAPDGTIIIRLSDYRGMAGDEIGVFAVGRIPSAIVSGDLNKDGKRDIVVANAGSDSLSVLLSK